MAAQNAGVSQDVRIEFRIGIHVGDIIIDDNDILGSYDYTMRAMPHVWALEKEESVKALELLEQALAIDPEYPLALSLAGCVTPSARSTIGRMILRRIRLLRDRSRSGQQR